MTWAVEGRVNYKEFLNILYGKGSIKKNRSKKGSGISG
jgi:hypothetical protein